VAVRLSLAFAPRPRAGLLSSYSTTSGRPRRSARCASSDSRLPDRPWLRVGDSRSRKLSEMSLPGAEYFPGVPSLDEVAPAMKRSA